MDQYLIYLRKSRADRDAEARGEGDTLARHRTALLELARKMGLSIAHIYEEVVSGDSISARPEMQRLLRDVEGGGYAGVLVMEVERLARGNTRDQGVVAETFQYSNTKIITPLKTYDPSDEADEEYFEFGLFMSRREYKTINRRLQRGRMASLHEGKYIAGAAPYGYQKVKLPRQKGYSLEIIPDQAEVVRRIFSLYVEGERAADGSIRRYGSFTIAKRLDAEGIPSPSGGKWPPCTVKDILINPTYAGMLRWSYRPVVKRMVDGDVVKSCPVNHNINLVPGIHPPIVSKDIWEEAQAILSSRSHPPMPSKHRLVNPLAGLVFCDQCGRSMERRKFTRGRDTIMCPNKSCSTMSSVLEEVESGIMDALRLWLADYKVSQGEHAPPSIAGVKEIRDSVSRLENNVATLRKQHDNLYDLLEQGIYTTEVFLERSKLLADRIASAEAAIIHAKEQLDTASALAEQQENLIPNIERILAEYNTLSSPQEKHDLLSEVLEKVTYSKSTGGRYGKSNMKISVFPKVK